MLAVLSLYTSCLQFPQHVHIGFLAAVLPNFFVCGWIRKFPSILKYWLVLKAQVTSGIEHDTRNVSHFRMKTTENNNNMLLPCQCFYTQVPEMALVLFVLTYYTSKQRIYLSALLYSRSFYGHIDAHCWVRLSGKHWHFQGKYLLPLFFISPLLSILVDFLKKRLFVTAREEKSVFGYGVSVWTIKF